MGLCRVDIVPTFVSKTNKIYLEFKSNANTSGEGFEIFYDTKLMGKSFIHIIHQSIHTCIIRLILDR